MKIHPSVENGNVFGCVVRCLLWNTSNTIAFNEFSGSVSPAQNLSLESDRHKLLIIAQVGEKLDNIICMRFLYT
jgi:hypothetical protein